MARLTKALLLILLALTSALSTFAQQTYTARVVDAATNEPLPFAQVYVGEGRGAVTNYQGTFSVNASPDETFKISYIGYTSAYIMAADLPQTVRLKATEHQLREVTVTPIQPLLVRASKKLYAEYKKHRTASSTFFLRIRNDFFSDSATWAGHKAQMTEAFIQGQSAVNLRQPIHLNNGGNTVFAPGVNLEHFSTRLEGTFKPTRNETLLFDIHADDMLRLIVNSDTIVDIWKVRHRIQGDKKELTVKAGQSYHIQIDYGQQDGYAALDFDIQHKFAPTMQQLLTNVGKAETVIFVGGIAPTLEGEEMKVSEPGFKGGDRTSIELPQAQRDVLKMLHDAGKKVIFVNCSGSAIALTPELESCDAIVQWWYDGEQGGTALAEVLFGNYNPSGKLPITFYKNTEELPDFLDYTMKNRTYRYYTGEARIRVLAKVWKPYRST